MPSCRESCFKKTQIEEAVRVSMDRLIVKIQEAGCAVVAGLDPKIDYVPEFIRQKNYEEFGRNVIGVTRAILQFNTELIDALCDVVPAVKVQAAYYEMYGLEGIGVLYRTLEYAGKKGLYVMLDGKRNDIGSTAEAYSAGWLGKPDLDGERESMCAVDCLTVNPYLGTDGIAPFVKDCKAYDKAIFALVKTSNPSSGELQDLLVDDAPLYEKVAALVGQWGEECMGKSGYSSVGAVVGATYPAQAERLRVVMPHTYFLVPGYGAQGATAADVAKSFNPDGLGAIVNSSRAIMCAYKKSSRPESEFAAAAKDEAYTMGKAILEAVGKR